MITIVDLVNTLANFIDNVVKDYRLPVSAIGIEKTKAPQVVKYFLPPKRSSEAPDFPCVIIRPVNGIDDLNEATLKVRIIIGAYAEDSQGIINAINIMERIRLKLYERGTLDNKYCLEKPCHYDIPEEQPHPEYFTSLEVKFNMYTPYEELLKWPINME